MNPPPLCNNRRSRPVSKLLGLVTPPVTPSLRRRALAVILAAAASWVLLSGAVPRAQAEAIPPDEAVQRMKLPPGFEAKLFASEPEVRQPVSMLFDRRGRLWVLQYLQYPAPAGLKAVKVDQYLRTTYDKVPLPPPQGPKGADRIIIAEDTDGDERADRFKDFVTGLNLASGMALGYGGLFVVQPPYLLFYPDRDGDDRPDGPPEVLLAGFGMEDAHAFANSLTWGPDGWLYGAQGSTVTAKIRGIEFQQGIWRYHPVTKKFELFAEGGGNTWGLDFDADGNVIAGTNYGDEAMLHQVQGAYYTKNFGKHGALHNPYAFGFFGHVPYRGFKGGHVTCGGIIYQGGAYPKEFEGVYIAGNLLANSVYWHVLEPHKSTFTAHFGGDFLVANDPAFRPIDCETGPDGSVYVADWYDRRATHVDPKDDWDRTTGRIYKIKYRGTPQPAPFDLEKKSGPDLVALLHDKNVWFRRQARQILAERNGGGMAESLRQGVRSSTDSFALECLWALAASRALDDQVLETLLDHRDPVIRQWAVRLIGDRDSISGNLAQRLVRLAETDGSPSVRSQLASTAKRLPASTGLPLVRTLVSRSEDREDPFIPLLLWWALEARTRTDPTAVLALFQSPAMWEAPLGGMLAQKLARRYAAENTDPGYRAGGDLLRMTRTPNHVELAARGFDEALQDSPSAKVPPALAADLLSAWQKQPASEALFRLAVRLKNPAAQKRALEIVADRSRGSVERLATIGLLGQEHDSSFFPALAALLGEGESDAVRSAALTALERIPADAVADKILEHYAGLSKPLRNQARNVLVSRAAWALRLLDRVEQGGIPTTDLQAEQLRRMAQFDDAEARRLLLKHWGAVQGEVAGEKQARIAAIIGMLRPARADTAAGKELFQKTCAVCHRLHGEGTEIGPDLTAVDRKDAQWLVSTIVDPSAIIRPEYMNYEAITQDGQILTGLLPEQAGQSVVLLDAAGKRHPIPRNELKSLLPAKVSLMPEGLLDGMDPDQIRDLIAYLQLP